MKIEDEVQEYKPEKPRNKTITIIAILIVLTVIALIGIGSLIFYLQSNKLAVFVDGKKVIFGEETFIFKEDSDDIYISIKDIAPLVGYEAHNGEYKVNSEDANKIYIEAINGSETTSFFLNSTSIAKVAPENTEDYERIEISKPVIKLNGELYINAEGFMQGFNVTFSYNKEKNRIDIQTLPYLVNAYSANVSNYGYDSISEEFNNQKALIYGMLVAYKESIQKYGVIDIKTGKEVISPRYNNIEFIEHSREFAITTSNNKVGIAYSTGGTKINVAYDEIKVLDSSRGYYLVKSNSKYGVINSNEELIIHIEYDQIGIEDSSLFPDKENNSQYILYDKIIPVCQNNKWGFFDINGNKLTEIEYDGIGCVITDELTERVVNSTLLIGDSEVVVVLKDNYYGGISTKGDLLIPTIFDYICSITSEGELDYRIVYNNVDYLAMDYIKLAKEKFGYSDEEDDSDNEDLENNQQGNAENGQNEENNNSNPTENQGEGNNINQNMEEQAVNAFNAQFEAYNGERSRGTTKALIDIISSSNALSDHKVIVEYDGNLYTDNVTGLKESITNNAYTVSVEYNSESGYIEKIIIR